MEQSSRKGIVFGYGMVDLPNSSQRSDNRKSMDAVERRILEEMKGLRLGPSVGPRQDVRYGDEDDHSPNRRVSDWVHQYNLHERSDSATSHSSRGGFRPGENMENWNVERDVYSKFSGKSRIAVDQGRNPYYVYRDEGSSMWNNSGPSKPDSEQDPVEIMRTLDELKGQLSRYCVAVDKPRLNNDRASPDRYYENIHVSRSQNREKFYPPRHDLAAYEDQFHGRTRLSDEYDTRRQVDINPQIPFDPRNPKDLLSANLYRESFTSHGSHPTPSPDVRPRERWTSDPESDVDSLSKPRRPIMRHKNEEHYRSIAGGAPLIACYDCFELLILPRNLINGKNKLQCGACSLIIRIEIKKKRLIIRRSKESSLLTSELDEDLPGLIAPNKSSDDFVDSGDKSDHNLEHSEQKSTLEDQKLKLSSSSSSVSSKGEDNPSHLIVQENTSNSAKSILSPEKDGQSDCSSEHAAEEHEEIQSNQDKIHSIQNSMEDVSESMELESSFDEFNNTHTSQDSIKIEKEEDQNKNSNGEEIYPADQVKKQNVFVNGHLIPDHLLIKAEKFAGKVLPGDYWYDHKAGFWGVIGNPCLGIIPSFIKEFNYPMPTNCAAGNTGVYVNGRELHQNDLDLLAARGLPSIRDRFYVVDMSGRVLDEDSGEELYYLGKLAPTIEKMKRGFGMKVPKPV